MLVFGFLGGKEHIASVKNFPNDFHFIIRLKSHTVKFRK